MTEEYAVGPEHIYFIMCTLLVLISVNCCRLVHVLFYMRLMSPYHCQSTLNRFAFCSLFLSLFPYVTIVQSGNYIHWEISSTNERISYWSHRWPNSLMIWPIGSLKNTCVQSYTFWVNIPNSQIPTVIGATDEGKCVLCWLLFRWLIGKWKRVLFWYEYYSKIWGKVIDHYDKNNVWLKS